MARRRRRERTLTEYRRATARHPGASFYTTSRPPRCGHHNSRGAQCVKDRGHGGTHRSASGKVWY